MIEGDKPYFDLFDMHDCFKGALFSEGKTIVEGAEDHIDGALESSQFMMLKKDTDRAVADGDVGEFMNVRSAMLSAIEMAVEGYADDAVGLNFGNPSLPISQPQAVMRDYVGKVIDHHFALETYSVVGDRMVKEEQQTSIMTNTNKPTNDRTDETYLYLTCTQNVAMCLKLTITGLLHKHSITHLILWPRARSQPLTSPFPVTHSMNRDC